MPNTVNGPAAPLEGKSAGRIVKKGLKGAAHGVGGAITIDSLGRKWNSELHPRDANGRFIETGGVASIPALGVRGKVVRSVGRGRVELRLPNGERKTYPGSQIRMVARPDGSKPVEAPDPKDASAFKKAITKINDEDERRLKDPKRGDGEKADDEGDWDGDGILNEQDETPLGEKKPVKGKKRKGGKDAGDGYTLHSKPEGGESADTNHTLEDSEGNIVGTATSGVPGIKNAWRGQVNGTPVTADTEQGWLLAAKRTHAQQGGGVRKPSAAGAKPAAAKGDAPKRPELADDKKLTPTDFTVSRMGRVMGAKYGEQQKHPIGQLKRDPERAGKFIAVHEDGTVLSGGSQSAALKNLADHHNGVATRPYKSNARAAAKPKQEITPAHMEERNALEGEQARRKYDLARNAGKNHIQAINEATPYHNAAVKAKNERLAREMDERLAAQDAGKPMPERPEAPAAAAEPRKPVRYANEEELNHLFNGPKPSEGGENDSTRTGRPETDKAEQVAAREDAEVEWARKVQELDDPGIEFALGNARARQKDALTPSERDRYKRRVEHLENIARERGITKGEAKPDPEFDSRVAKMQRHLEPGPDFDRSINDNVDRARNQRSKGDHEGAEKWLAQAEAHYNDRQDRERARREERDQQERDRQQRDSEARRRDEEQTADTEQRDNESSPTEENSTDERESELRGDRGASLEGDAADGVPANDAERADGAVPAAGGRGEGAGARSGGRGADAAEPARDVRAGAGEADDRVQAGRGSGDQGDSAAGAGRGGDTDGPGSDRGYGRAQEAGLLEPIADEHPNAPKFKPKSQANLAPDTDKERAKANIEALRTLRALEQENRPATPAEQAKLARWAGWGSIAQEMFSNNENHMRDYAKERAAAAELMSPEEIDSARRNALNAHYTDARMVEPMWDALRELGFDGGQVLEPGSGSGNFMGFAPDNADMVGVELEPITAKISHYLYPDATIANMSISDFRVPEGTFDAVIGNVPFNGAIKPHDPISNPGRRHNLHNYSIIKSLDTLREGGIAAVITSAYTMDSQDATSRQAMHDRADLIGAIRLPAGAHKAAAGTDVVTDLLIFRKRKAGESPGNAGWVRSDKWETDAEGKNHYVNSIFRNNPSLVVGKMKMSEGGGQNAKYQMTVEHDGDFVPEFKTQLAKAVKRAKDFNLTMSPRPEGEKAPKVKDVLAESADATRIGSVAFKDGKFVTLGADGKLEEVKVPKTQHAKMKKLLALRDAAAELLDLERSTTEGDDKKADALRAKLNKLYDDYVSKNKSPEYPNGGAPINDSKWAQSVSDKKLRDDEQRWDVRTADLEVGNIIEWPELRDKKGAPRRAVIAEVTDDGHFVAEIMGVDAKDGRRQLLDPALGDRHKVVGQRTWNKYRKRQLPPAFESDPQAGLVINLEAYDAELNTATKGSILKGRTMSARTVPEVVEDPETAITMLLDEEGSFDMKRAAKIMGKSEADAREALRGTVFADPSQEGRWVSREEYLSGDVREKLREAEAAAEANPELRENVEALEDVLPAWIDHSRIKAKLGASWIERDHVEQFVRELVDDDRAKVTYSPTSGWKVEGTRGDRDALVGTEWGTINGTFIQTDADGKELIDGATGEPMRVPFPGRGRNAYELVETALNHGKIKVTYKVKDTTYTDEKGTLAAQEKLEQVKDRFSKWVWEDADRRTALLERYNNDFNSLVKREYSDAPMDVEGLSDKYELYPHQASAVRRVLSEPATLIAHEVGAGKTLEMATAAMELRRRGLAKKPMIVVPNHMKEQWQREFLDAFPQARVLAVSSDDLKDAKARRSYLAKAAAGDWDAVIITHSTFGTIGLSRETQRDYINNELAQMRRDISDAASNGADEATVKKMEERMAAREEKLKEKLAKATDSGVSFEQLGVDYLMVDEAHEFKNLERLSGTDEAIDGSDKATDLHAKLFHLRKTNDSGRYVTFATATPVSNSFGETHTVMKYLRPDLLEKGNVASFDRYISNFANIAEDVEMTPDGGSFVLKQRIRSFTNAPGMFRMWQQVADVQTAEDLDLDTPDVDGDRPEMVLIEPSDWFKNEYVPRLIQRAEAAKNAKREKGQDNILVINNDGKAAALDPRMVGGPEAENGGKIGAAVSKIMEIHEQTKDNRYTDPISGEEHARPGGLQLVFLDMGTPGSYGRFQDKLDKGEEPIGDSNGFEAYEELKRQLIAQGIPENQIAFMHDAKGDSLKKAKLFAKARNGELSVLVGSTALMGVGTNVQHRATALHHLDVPYRPSDLAQRNGRVIRQKNQNSKVRILQYAVDGSLDSRLWDIQERKSRFIGQLMKGDLSIDEFEELSDTVINASEMKAFTSGNRHLLDQIKVKKAQNVLAQQKQAIETAREDAKRRIAEVDRVVPVLERNAERLEKIAKDLPKPTSDVAKYDMTVEVAGKPATFESRNDLIEAMRDAALRALADGRGMMDHDEAAPLGTVAGYAVEGRYRWNQNRVMSELEITLPDVPDAKMTLSKEGLTKADLPTRLENIMANLGREAEGKRSLIRQRLRDRKNALPMLEKEFSEEDQQRLDALNKRLGRLNRAIEFQAENGREKALPDELEHDAPEVEKVLGKLEAPEEVIASRPEPASLKNLDDKGEVIPRWNKHLERKKAKEVATAKSAKTKPATSKGARTTEVNPEKGKRIGDVQTRALEGGVTQVFENVHGNTPGAVKERVLATVQKTDAGDWTVHRPGDEDEIHRAATRDAAVEWAEKEGRAGSLSRRPEGSRVSQSGSRSGRSGSSSDSGSRGTGETVSVPAEELAGDAEALGIDLPKADTTPDAPEAPAGDDVDTTPRIDADARNTRIVHDQPADDGESIEEVTTHVVDTLDNETWSVWRGERADGDPVESFPTREEAEKWALSDAGAPDDAPEASVTGPDEFATRREDAEALDGIDDPATRDAMKASNDRRAEEARRRDEVEAADEGGDDVTVQQAQEAYDFLGAEEADGILGDGGLSGASPAAMRELVRRAEEERAKEAAENVTVDPDEVRADGEATGNADVIDLASRRPQAPEAPTAEGDVPPAPPAPEAPAADVPESQWEPGLPERTIGKKWYVRGGKGLVQDESRRKDPMRLNLVDEVEYDSKEEAEAALAKEINRLKERGGYRQGDNLRVVDENDEKVREVLGKQHPSKRHLPEPQKFRTGGKTLEELRSRHETAEIDGVEPGYRVIGNGAIEVTNPATTLDELDDLLELRKDDDYTSGFVSEDAPRVTKQIKALRDKVQAAYPDIKPTQDRRYAKWKQERDGVDERGRKVAPKAPTATGDKTPPPPPADAPEKDETPIVESVNEGQLEGQLRIGGDDVRSEITEDWMKQEEAPAPKPAPEPEVPTQDGPSLLDEPGVTDAPEADAPESRGTRGAVLDGMAPADHAWLDRRLRTSAEGDSNKDTQAIAQKWVNGEDLTPEEIGSLARLFDAAADIEEAQGNTKTAGFARRAAKALHAQEGDRTPATPYDLTPGEDGITPLMRRSKDFEEKFKRGLIEDFRKENGREPNRSELSKIEDEAFEAAGRFRRDETRRIEQEAAAGGDGRDGGDRTPDAPATPDEPGDEDVPEPEDRELPDTDEDLNVVPEPEEPRSENAPERLPGEKFDPTPQQQQVYDAVADGKDVVIQAKAGAGKTSTLEGLARRIERDNPDDKIAYIAFNKSVQVEAAGRMPGNVEPRTGHSIAFAWANDDLKERFDRRGLRRPDEIARHLGINDKMSVPGEKALSPKEQAMAVVRTIDTFANSAEDEIGVEHLPERMRNLPKAEQDALVAYARKGWKDLLDAKGGKMHMTLDHMRKMWALSKPDFTKAGSGLKRRATVLFLDEAQDTPPVLAKVIADQKMRKVIVGDADQAIYGFTGATDYLSTALSDVELPLTKSFRFGPQVAAWGNRFLQLLGSKGRVEGAGPDSKIVHDMQDADAILVRSNGGMIGELMKELDKGRTVGVPKGTKKDLLALVETARYLKGEGPAPERMHDDLEPFRTWSEVVEEAGKGDDAKLKMLTRIVADHGVDKLDEIVQQVTELGDDALSGVEFENMPHGLVAKGKTFGVKEDLKAAGFRWMEVPGEKIASGKNKGQPLKAWTATGTEEQRESRLARVREALAGPEPDVVVSTAHKAKGLEWDRVKIGDDFQGPKQDPDTGAMILPNADENRLAYVAVTRAQKELDPGSLSWVEDYTDENGGTPGQIKPKATPEAPAVDAPEAPATEAPKAPEAPKTQEPDDGLSDLAKQLRAEQELANRGLPFSHVLRNEQGEDYSRRYAELVDAVKAEMFDGGPKAVIPDDLREKPAEAGHRQLSWPEKATPTRVEVAPGQPGEGQRKWIHDGLTLVFTDATTGNKVVGQVHISEGLNAKGKKSRGDQKDVTRRLLMKDGRVLLMDVSAKPASFHPDSHRLNSVHHRPERLAELRTHMLEYAVDDLERDLSTLRGMDAEQRAALNEGMAKGSIRSPYEIKDPNYDKLVERIEHVLGLHHEELAKRDDRGVERAEIEKAKAADAARRGETPAAPEAPAAADATPEAPAADAPEAPAADPNAPREVGLDKNGRLNTDQLKAGDVVEVKRTDTGELDEITVESVRIDGAHDLITGFDKDGKRAYGRVPSGIGPKLVKAAPANAEDAWERPVADVPASDEPGPTLPGDLRVGDLVQGKVKINGRSVSGKFRITKVHGKKGMMHQFEVETGAGDRLPWNVMGERPQHVLERADVPERNPLDDKTLDALISEYGDELKKTPLDDARIAALEEAIDRKENSAREQANDLRRMPLEDMSDDELMQARTAAELTDDAEWLGRIGEELRQRDEHQKQWGERWEPRKPAEEGKPKTKAEQEKEWTDELWDHNKAVLLNHYRQSGYPYAEDAMGDAGVEMLSGLSLPDRKALLNGKKVPGIKLARMDEEATMALWKKTPSEIAKSPDGYNIPGTIHKDDWIADKRRGGDGFGNGSDEHSERERDLFLHADPQDLDDDELDKAIHHAGDDDERREELLTERSERDKKGDDERERDRKERERRRVEDNEVPEGDVRDLDGKELDEQSKRDDEDGDRARGEKHRREQLDDDEREEEEERRRERRRRRNRRNRRRRRRGGHNRPHLGLPHMPHLNLPDDLPHLPEDDEAKKAGKKGAKAGKKAAKKGEGRIPGHTGDVEESLGKQDAEHSPVDDARDLTDTVDKPGHELTPDERAADNAAIDNAYGDPASDLDAFVAAEDLPEGGKPGSGTVGGATRDEIDPTPANESRLGAFLRGLNPEGRKVTDLPSLYEALGPVDGDRLVEGRGIPASHAADLPEADTKALFGKTPDELRAMGDKPVKWVLADDPEKAVKPHAPKTPVDDAKKPAPATPSVPGEPGDALPRKEAFEKADGEWATIPAKDLKPGDLIWSKGKTWPVDDTKQHDSGEVSVHAWRPEGGHESGSGFGTRYAGDAPVQVHVPVGRAVDKGKGDKAERTKRRKAENAVAQHKYEQEQAKRLADEGGPLGAPNADGTVNAGSELPLSKFSPQEQLDALTNADAVVSGVTKSGQPFLGQVRSAGGQYEVDAPDGTPMPLDPHEIASMRLISGEVAMPAAESVPADRLRPGSAFRGSFEYGDQGQPIRPVYRVVSAEPGKPLRAVGEDGQERTINGDSSTTRVQPITRHSVDAPESGIADAPEADAPAADAPEVDAPAAPDAGVAEPDAPAAPEADVAEPEAPAAPEPPRAPSGPARTDADMFSPDPEPADEPSAGEQPTAPEQEWDGAGASTLPRKPEAPATERTAPEAPEGDEPKGAPAVVRPMDRVDDVPTAEERITGQAASWVTPDALQIGDYARVEGMDDNGRPLELAGYLANDPQPAEFQPADGSAPTDVLGILLSEKGDGLGEQTMVWVPLDRLAALSPRPEADDVVAEGEQFANNKLDVKNGRMPKRIPADSTGKFGLFPRTLVTDTDGQREGIVIAARGNDVDVRWGAGEVESVAGQSLKVTDEGIQRPHGWTRDGRRVGKRIGRDNVRTPDPAQQKPVESAEQRELFDVVRNEADEFVKKIGDHLSGKKRMSKAEFDRTLQGILRQHLKDSQGRRVQFARRAAARRPYQAGLLARLVTALADLTAAVLKAIIATLRWLFNDEHREWASENGQRAARAIVRRARQMNEGRRVQRLLGMEDDAPAGEVADLMDAMD